MFALDTNTLIYFFKGKGRVADQLLSVAPQDIGIPALVLFELEVGIAKSNAPAKRRSQLQQFLESVKILPFDALAAQASARIRAELECQGQPIGPLDCLIAGTALANRATLVTHHLKEFDRIKGLETVDWF